MALIDYSWHKVANAKPRMSSHVQVERHFYRGQPWYVLYDKASGRSHRFTSAMYRLLCLMNGERTLQQIWDILQKSQNAPSKDEVLSAFNQLQMMELLQGDIAPGGMEERQKNWAKLRLRQRYGSPFSIRFALWDPDEFLQRFLPHLRLFFSPWFFVLWLGMVGYGIMLAAQNWALLTRDIADHVLAPNNLIIMLLLFPIIKLLHELGHAFTTRRWGGEVHELGILILVFMPLPYVEASSASAFPDKRARILVSAAGMMVELFIAALAMLLWVNVEPGLVRAMAYNVMFISSISTLLFNGNPLLRFDGYYLLADAIEIPNLVSRSNRYMGYLFQRYLLNIKELFSPAESRGEAGWLVFYGIAAFFYRLFISAVIILFVASKFFIVGVLVAIWAVYLFLVSPLIRHIRYLLTHPMLQQRRLRLIFVLGTLLTVLGYGLFWLPVPFWSNVEGVIWLPEQSEIRVETAGFCHEIVVQPGQKVAIGDKLMVLKNDELETKYRELQYQLEELEAKYRYALYSQKDRVTANVLREKIDTVRADLAKHKEQIERLVVYSSQNGRIYIPNDDRLLGRFLSQGELVAYVVEPPINMIRAVVQQKDIALVRHDLVQHQKRFVEVRLAEKLQLVYPAVIEQAVPEASKQLPSQALGKTGGGSIPLAPNDEEGLRAYEAVFQFDVRLQGEVSVTGIGGRAYLRFYHGKKPLALQWYRSIRRLFLRRFEM